jgi:integrase
MVYRRGRIWWYKFRWVGEEIRESSKGTNKRNAEKMEAAHKTKLALGEVGIREKKTAPTLTEFMDQDFIPYLERTGPKKAEYYGKCVRKLKSFAKLAKAHLDQIDHDLTQEYIEFRKLHRFEFRTGKGRQQVRGGKPLQIGTLNRDLATLRRMLKLAAEWGRVSKLEVRVRLLPGENRRNRALTEAEDAAYLKAALEVGYAREEACRAALKGIRATQRGQHPRPRDAFQLHDLTIIMLDSGLRPDEAYRLKPENIREGAIWIFEGKTAAARRRIPIMTERLRGVLEMRIARTAAGGWLFPADTKSGHIEESSLKKQHKNALKASGVAPFELYILRHTCLTRWGEYMDSARLQKYAGHADFKTTLRYIHPRDESMEEAMERARLAREVRLARGNGHSSGHSAENGSAEAPVDVCLQ